MWSIIFSSLALANPEDIESLGNSGSSSQDTEQSKQKSKQENNKEAKKKEELEQEELEQEELEQEELEQEELEQEQWEQEEQERQDEDSDSYYDMDDQDNIDNFGSPDDLEHQEDLDPHLFESHAQEEIHNQTNGIQNNQEQSTQSQGWWNSNSQNLVQEEKGSNEGSSTEGLHQAVYDTTSQDDLTDEEREHLKNDQAAHEDSVRKKYQQNLTQDEILFSTLQENQKNEQTELGNTNPTTEDTPNFGSEYQGKQDPNVYKSGLTTYQAAQIEETKESDGFNPYNSGDTFSVQANDGVDNMYRPENSKGFTVGLNHDFENPYDVENLLNQNSTLQNAVKPASEIQLEDVPEINYGKQNTGTSVDTSLAGETSSGQQTIPNIPTEETYKPQLVKPTETMSLPDISKEYRLGSGDTITIYAWAGDFIERNISKNYVVADTGYIQLPIIGSVKIGNLTTSEASALITDTLSEYIKNPIVQLQMQRPQSQKIWLLGNISRPGVVFLDGPKTLIQALSERGLTRRKRGNGAWAETKIHVQREDGTVLIVDTENLLETGEGNIYLRGGDSIFITDGSYIYLNGKFQRSGPVAFSEGMTVSDACAEAMGYDKEANLRKLYIYRNGKQIEVDLKAIFQGDAEDVTLEQGDRLYLEESLW
jgi:polysaccharide biosynthesis/export protein